MEHVLGAKFWWFRYDGHGGEMMRAPVLAASLIACVVATSVHAAHVWILEGLGAATTRPDCQNVSWGPVAVAHNRGSEAGTVRPLHASNGVTINLPQTIPGASSIVLKGGVGFIDAWITELDVPEGVDIEGRMDMHYTSCFPYGPPVFEPFSKIGMPVFHHLIPPGQDQIHYGTDLGGAETRQNVGIYNAGAVAASATIEVKQAFCGSSLMKTATIPADTFVQIPLGTITPCSGGESEFHSISTYTVVRVDQPSLSLVSTLRNGAIPDVTASVSGSD